MNMLANNQRAMWDEFRRVHPKIEFVWLQYLAYNATPLIQVLPVQRFTDLVQAGEPVPFVKAGIHLEPFDRLPTGVTPGGVCYLRPLIPTTYCKDGPGSHRAVVMASCLDANGDPMDICPRSRLVALEQKILEKTGHKVSVGFEIEAVYLRREKEDNKTIGYKGLDEPHSIFSMTADDQTHLDMLEETARSLLTAGIALEKFHAEAAPGQWEFVLPPGSAVQAVDMLLKAKSIISDVAEKYGLRATMCPRPLGRDPCSGMHAHLSFNSVKGQDEKAIEAFFAGIIDHLPAVMAFTLARDMSYSRVANGICSGGEYACWGWQNKEVALRRISTTRFEMKLLDGLANPYLALCGLLAAGLDGWRRKLPLTAGSCPFATDKLSVEEREALGVTTLLPKSLPASLDALEADSQLREVIGDSIVTRYVAMKRAEVEVFHGMDETDKRNYLIGRY